MRRRKNYIAAALLAACLASTTALPVFAGPESAVEEDGQQYTADVSEKVRETEAAEQAAPQETVVTSESGNVADAAAGEESMADDATADPGEVADTPAEGESTDESVSGESGLETATPPTTPVPIETKTPTTNDLTRWSPLDDADTAKTVDLDLVEGLNKIELFYGPNTNGAPGLSFSSDKGRSYIAGTDNIENDDFVFVKKQGKSLAPEFSTVGFITVYIKKTGDENWKMTVTRRDGTDFFIAVLAEVPEDYSSIVTDYRTKPVKQLLWMDRTDGNTYVQFIPSIIKKDAEAAAASQKPQGEDPVEKHVNPFIIPAIVLLIAALVSTVYMKSKQKKDAAAKEVSEREQYIKRSNAKRKKQQKEENDNLASYLNKYEDDYTDSDVDMTVGGGNDDYDMESEFDEPEDDYEEPVRPARPARTEERRPVRRTEPARREAERPTRRPVEKPVRRRVPDDDYLEEEVVRRPAGRPAPDRTERPVRRTEPKRTSPAPERRPARRTVPKAPVKTREPERGERSKNDLPDWLK